MSTTRELTKNYSGIFGNQVVLKNRRGKSVMTIPPVKPITPLSEGQIAVRERFKLAAKYARESMQNPDLLEMYTAKSRKGLTPYRLAVNDNLKKPYIHKVDTSCYSGNPGEKVNVTAGDDFKLASVKVRISNPDGTTIEEGDCVMTLPTGNYEYTTTTRVSGLAGITIQALVKDIPGNETTMSVTL